MRILLVEPERSISEPVAEFLREEGFETTVASTVEQAHRLGPAGPWVAIVADLTGHSLYELAPADAALLRDLVGWGPVVLTGARAWLEEARPSDLGVAAILPKPYDLDALLASIRSVLGAPRGGPTQPDDRPDAADPPNHPHFATSPDISPPGDRRQRFSCKRWCEPPYARRRAIGPY